MNLKKRRQSVQWPTVVIDNTELNMERTYQSLDLPKEFKKSQMKRIQSLSYSELIEDIKIPNRYSPELIEWELQRREHTRSMTHQKVEELNEELKRTREQKLEEYRQFIYRQVNDQPAFSLIQYPHISMQGYHAYYGLSELGSAENPIVVDELVEDPDSLFSPREVTHLHEALNDMDDRSWMNWTGN